MVGLLFAMLVVLYGCGGPAFTTSTSADTADTGMRDAGGVEAAARDSSSPPPPSDSSQPTPQDSGLALDSSPVDSSHVDVEPDVCAPVTHANGVGQTWTDCAPLGTYNETEAMQACMADSDAGGGCYFVTRPCNNDGIESAVCSAPSLATFCWTYAGMFTGYAAPAPGCPTSADPMWR
jgi:hypothetical protein